MERRPSKMMVFLMGMLTEIQNKRRWGRNRVK